MEIHKIKITEYINIGDINEKNYDIANIMQQVLKKLNLVIN